MKGGEVKYEEVRGEAVQANCHQMVLKQVRQQAVTGKKRSVTDGRSVVNLWKYLHCNWMRSKTIETDSIVTPTNLVFYNLCLHLSPITLVLTSMPQKPLQK